MIGLSRIAQRLAMATLLGGVTHEERVATRRRAMQESRLEVGLGAQRAPKVYSERELRAMRSKYQPHIGARQARPPVGWRR
jgi:hypothetical protein